MRGGVVILVLVWVAPMIAYGCVSFAGMSPTRSGEQSSRPDLAWLKDEFNWNDAEFKRVCELHAAYLPQCREMCRKIDAQNQRLFELVAATNQMTAEIEAAIVESSRLRVQCQRNMLEHFYAVSRTMPTEQGRRAFA